MTNLRECPECHRMVKTLTRGVCHGRCYKRHIREGTRESLPHTTQERVKRMERVVEEYRQILESHPEMTQREIAAKLGVHPSTLSTAAVRRGIRKPRRSGVGYSDWKSVVEDYWMLVDSGETNKDLIAGRIGVSTQTLERALKAVQR
jgi:predicted DNA-binding protein (UPF0251 family)